MNTHTTTEDLAPRLTLAGTRFSAIRTYVSGHDSQIMLVGKRGAEYGPFESDDAALRYADFVTRHPKGGHR